MADNKKPKPYETTAGISWIATRQMQNRIQLEIQKLYKEINVEQLLVLMELDYEDGLRPSVLAERLQRSKGTMTSLIRHAEKMNTSPRLQIQRIKTRKRSSLR